MAGARAPVVLATGTVLADRYRLEHPLGQGAMGSVWRAEHLALHSHVALKIIDPQVAKAPLGLTRFLREARLLASLRSPYLVQVTDFGSERDVVYLVMELLEGITLDRRLKLEGTLSPQETNRILSEVCKAMSHTHERRLVHRDLKPDNVFLCDDSQSRVTKVVDFGIAKSIVDDLDGGSGTRTGSWLGTPSYMSPEQCRGLKAIDHRSDLWAIGVIAYECLVGQRPFDGAVVGELVLRICSEPLPIPSEHGRVPKGFDAWFAKAVAREPSERFSSAEEMAAELDRICGSEPELVGVPSLTKPAPASGGTFATTELVGSTRESSREPRSRRRELAIAIGIGAAIAGTLILAAVSGGKAPGQAAQPASDPVEPTPPAAPSVAPAQRAPAEDVRSMPPPPPAAADSSAASPAGNPRAETQAPSSKKLGTRSIPEPRTQNRPPDSIAPDDLGELRKKR